MGKKMMDREIRWETGFALRRSGTWALEVSIKKGGRKSEVTRETRIGQGELRSQVQYPGSMRRVNMCEHQDVMAM